HLTTSVGDVMLEGTHAVRLNLESTTYISSAGIGVLGDLHRQFTAVNGSFLVTNPSRAVSTILYMVGLTARLIARAPAGCATASGSFWRSRGAPRRSPPTAPTFPITCSGPAPSCRGFRHSTGSAAMADSANSCDSKAPIAWDSARSRRCA